MPSEFSFDVVSEVDLNIVSESVQVAMKEISNRFDFKDASASLELNAKEKTLVVRAADENRVNAAWDVLMTRLAKRDLPLKNFTKYSIPEAIVSMKAGTSRTVPISWKSSPKYG